MKIPVVFWSGQSIKLVNFGIFAAFGSTLGYSISFFYLHTRGIQDTSFYWAMALILVLFNLFFAKFYSIFSIGLSNYFGNFRHFINETSFYQQGGIIGLILGTLLLYFISGIPIALLGDAVCLGGIVIMFVGRIGCHYYGCCTGKPMTGRFGVIYTDVNAKICRDDPRMMNTPLIPVQLISSAIDFLIFIICCIVSIHYPFSGLIMMIFFIGVNFKRIVIQKFRLKTNTNKIPYRWVAFTLIVSFIIILLIFHTIGQKFFELIPSEVPVKVINYFRFLISDLNILTSLMVVGAINFAAYGINGRRVGTHF